ncbi:HAUS augmin-like complex subunit 5 isoform X1 [Pelobates cultripes]|uniref:HAUS augmin-like complex subunit 5 isoform X1 n=2 Tax=Pelobates cultripes TaxID=61616 RepID=A0AAD1T5W5_PELCU|nr:HAUS augmin-like complex subunit 5 isoform X1 [Pelobates cultripes]
MDRKSLAQEVRRWAIEEMGLSAQKAPSEEMLQRLFIGQCADIWKYIIRHVFSQGTVKKIEGNLLWYQQLQQSETQRSAEEEQRQRRKQLCQQILDLRSELQHLQEQIRCSEQEIACCNLSSERSQDICRRAMLLHAFKEKKDIEIDFFNSSFFPLLVRNTHLQNVSRSSQRPVHFGPADGGEENNFHLESGVLKEVRETCNGRFAFLRSVHGDALRNSILDREHALDEAHEVWKSESQKVWCTRAPNHVLAALKHYAVETTNDLRKLQKSSARPTLVVHVSIPNNEDDDDDDEVNDDDVQAVKDFLKGCQQTRQENLPSFQRLLQEGWEDCARVTSDLHLVQHRIENLSESLSSVIQEIHKHLSEGGEITALTRTAFDTELRAVLLRGYRDGLLGECRELQETVIEKKNEANVVQNKKREVEEQSQLLEKKQAYLQSLIKENSNARAHIKRMHQEVRLFIQNKLCPFPQQLVHETERLRDYISKELKHFSAIFLPSFQRVSVEGGNQVPLHELSINRLSNMRGPYYGVYKGLYNSMGLSLYRAPECLLNVVADLKKNLFFMHTQLATRNKAIQNLQQLSNDRQNSDSEALLKMLAEHYGQQTNELLPKLQFLIYQCRESQEYGKDVQAAITDWWEQPAQQCLPWEQRGGLTLQQWRDRWTVAVTALQRASGGRS